MSMSTNEKVSSMSGLMHILEKQRALNTIILFISSLTIHHTITATNI